MNKRQKNKELKRLDNFKRMKSFIHAMVKGRIPKSMWSCRAKRIMRGRYK